MTWQVVKIRATPWAHDKWKHEKCHTKLHVFRYGIELHGKCYCGRTKLSHKNTSEQFIESKPREEVMADTNVFTTNVSLTLGELVIVSGLLVGHRMRMSNIADETQWNVLEELHKKIVSALIESTDKAATLVKLAKGESNGKSDSGVASAGTEQNL